MKVIATDVSIGLKDIQYMLHRAGLSFRLWNHLAVILQKLGSQALAEKYCYQDLYDMTLTQAQQNAEKTSSD